MTAPLDRPSAPEVSAVDRLRLRVRVEGTVQGVGFRPHVYRLVRAAGLGGFVRNDERGVLLELEGAPRAVLDVVERLEASPPPLAVIDRLHAEPAKPTGEHEFVIDPTTHAGAAATQVSADGAVCADCVAELFDAGDRRYRYPFVNCTNCGPRFTIVRGIPYDRPATTMAGFAMCPRCRAEYEDPLDRRFHAQPNACPECGPRLSLADAAGRVSAQGDEALAGALAALAAGGVVAIKGLGGFHLACRADDEPAVARLRRRKRREEKPFALMVRDLAMAGELVHLDPPVAELMASRARPIVLAPRRAGADVAAAVAPGRRELGLMLPYTPLHHLLFADFGRPLVLTSGNVSDEPIAFEDHEALARLGPLVERFLLHDRPIETRADDSVSRTVRVGARRRPLLLRRSRGYVPAPLGLPVATPRPLLACGGQLKNTFCLAAGALAWLGPHVGDLDEWEARRSFVDGIAHFRRLFEIDPEVAVHDLHPDYASTAHALALDGVETLGVQHHHAHLAAVLAEHGEPGPAIGVIFDGSGDGGDGTVWGGELLLGDLTGFQRVGHLLPTRLPGGEQAVRQPWRMACAWLREATGAVEPPRTLARRIDAARWRRVAHLAALGTRSPVTTSVGRLFDAAAALAGVRLEVSHEGQAAIELEALADPAERGRYDLELIERDGRLLLDPRPALRRLVADADRDLAPGRIAARFHRGLAAATVEACVRLAARHATERVALGGGVFQNRLLLEAVADGLLERGLRPLVPSAVPPNDGGLAFGQAAIAAARLAAAD